MNPAITETALSINFVGEEIQSVCKTLTHNPNAGAVVFLFPQDQRRATFQFIRVTYAPQPRRIKFSIAEYASFPTTLIGYWENGWFSSVYPLTDLEECWFEKIHSKGLEGVLSLLPVIRSAHFAALANKTSPRKPV